MAIKSPAQAPARPRQSRCLYSGTRDHPVYVDYLAPAGSNALLPVVMLHGGGHTGACYLMTPDGRRGWAELFADAGHPVYVPDWPGHGRSPMRDDFNTLSGHQVVEALTPLFERVGPAILLAHSASGPMAWMLAERLPDLVRAVIGIAPGAPANLIPMPTPDDLGSGHIFYSDEAEPIWVDDGTARRFWTNGERFPMHVFPDYRKSIVAESPRIMNERFNFDGRGLSVTPGALSGCPILVVTGETDLRHPRPVDEATAAFLGGEFCWLPDRGIRGNGHMLMLENNSDEIAELILGWIARRFRVNGVPHGPVEAASCC